MSNGVTGWKAVILKSFMKFGWSIIKIIEFLIKLFNSFSKNK